ncbi:hypothetical protein MHYP_G00137710 [Metynnis hypsauchen]
MIWPVVLIHALTKKWFGQYVTHDTNMSVNLGGFGKKQVLTVHQHDPHFRSDKTAPLNALMNFAVSILYRANMAQGICFPKAQTGVDKIRAGIISLS